MIISAEQSRSYTSKTSSPIGLRNSISSSAGAIVVVLWNAGAADIRDKETVGGSRNVKGCSVKS